MRAALAYLFLGLLFLLTSGGGGFAQESTIKGRVTTPNGKGLDSAELGLANTSWWSMTDGTGKFRIEGVEKGRYRLQVFAYGFRMEERNLRVDTSLVELELTLDTASREFEAVSVQGDAISDGPEHLSAIDGLGIYAAKKSQVVRPEKSGGDRSNDNPRELFSEVSGIVSHSDGDGGLQMDIGSRGLDPQRSAHFNMRQNGYDMSADALGYPEAYYTPPSHAVERIEVVRGAASLQYGPQFGGMVNFVLRGPPEAEGFKGAGHLSYGSFGFYDHYLELGGRQGESAVQGYVQRRSGNGWRENSGFEQNNAHLHFEQGLGDRTTLSLEYTRMKQLRQQPGGLTDRAFEEDPQQSLRERNWFGVEWNLGALRLKHRLSKDARVGTRFFGLMGKRDAVGILDRIDRMDHGEERLLLKDRYRNFGNETRYLQHYRLGGKRSTLLMGGRYYEGNTFRRQGPGTDGKGPDFSYLQERTLDSRFRFPSRNLAFFAENIFWLSDQWSITPGLRYERIRTASEGWFHQVNRDLAGNILHEATVHEERSNERDLLLYGLGVGYKMNSDIELYGNFSSNYRGIGFNDMRLVNPNFEVDPDLKDESGFTGDLGLRGKLFGFLHTDISVFTLYYRDRIGAVLKVDEASYRTYRLRTNIADSRNVGVEAYLEFDLAEQVDEESELSLSPFLNLTRQEAVYINSEESAFEGNQVEMAPERSTLLGVKGSYKDFRMRFQVQSVSRQFADATNAESIPSAEVGEIPAYQVADLSLGYSFEPITLQAGVHNLFDSSYFTHRAKGYSGPGIVPAPPRNFYLTLSVDFGSDG